MTNAALNLHLLRSIVPCINSMLAKTPHLSTNTPAPPDGTPGKRTGVRHGGTVYIYSMFGDEVIVPMYDLHFRALHVRGFWVSEWLRTLTRTQRQAALQVPCLLTFTCSAS